MPKILKRTRAGRSKKAVVVVKEDIAQALGMSVEEAEIRVNAILQRHKILPACFLSVLIENKKALICTTRANIECDKDMITSNVRPANVGYAPGRNATGA